MVLGSDGSVWGWGANGDGELGNGTTTSELRPVEILDGAVTGISAGCSHALALLRGGSVLAWGDGLFGTGTGTGSLTPEVVPSLAGATQISAGADYSLAVHQVVLVFVPGAPPGRSGDHPAPRAAPRAGPVRSIPALTLFSDCGGNHGTA